MRKSLTLLIYFFVLVWEYISISYYCIHLYDLLEANKDSIKFHTEFTVLKHFTNSLLLTRVYCLRYFIITRSKTTL